MGLALPPDAGVWGLVLVLDAGSVPERLDSGPSMF